MKRPSGVGRVGGAVRDRAIEARLVLGGRYRPRAELSWPLERGRLDEISIEWPERYFWPPTEAWLEPLRTALASFVRVTRADLPQTDTPVVLIRVRGVSGIHEVAIDYSDYMDVDEEIADRVPLYFKLQHATDGYGARSIVPGGYVPHSDRIYALLGGLRGLRSDSPNRRVFGRFSPNNELRRRAVSLLEAQDGLAFDGGLVLQRYGAYLAEAARAGVCLDLPGRGPICFRLIDYLAVGCCIVAAPHAARLHVPLEAGVHVATTNADMTDVVEVCRQLIEDPERRARQTAAAAEFFDRYLEGRQLGAYYLHQILSHISPLDG